MSQSYYNLYKQAIVQLASTILIKSDRTADLLNMYVFHYFGIQEDQEDKSSWKYYLNITGQYHPTDELIEITSLDDLSKITFSRQTLLDHPLTLKEYSYGSRYYRELITKFPNMEMFILGCLYPADMDKAISARDGEILSYPEHLVEENEESLIENIQSWIYNFKARWDNKQFNESDDLYCAANLGVMYVMLIPLIFNLRLKACLSNEAHSYHVRQFLASHGFLDQYIDFLTIKQKLFLYRNIRYIERNNGKVSIFKLLIEKLFSDRNLPIAQYTMKHNNAPLLDTYYNDVLFRREELNSSFSQTVKTRPYIGLDRLLQREEFLTPGNSPYIKDNKSRILRTFENSLSSTVTTKVLESSAIDYTDSENYSLTEIKLGHWLNNSYNNLYNAVITFKDPITSEEKVLNTFDAYVYWFYCYCASVGINLDAIPNLFVYKSTRIEELTTQDFISKLNLDLIKVDDIDELLQTKTPQLVINNVNFFIDLVTAVYNNYKKQQIILSNENHFYKHGLLKWISNQLYVSKDINTLDIMEERDGIRYRDFNHWFAQKNLSLNIKERSQYEILHLDIFKQATGGEFHTVKQLGELQKAMVRLMTQLSSYSIQILTEINSQSIRKINWGSIRLGAGLIYQNAVYRIQGINTYINKVAFATSNFVKISIPNLIINPSTSISTFSINKIRIDVKLKATRAEVKKKFVIRFGTSTVNHSFVNPVSGNAIRNLTSFQNFYSLAQEEQRVIKDIYFNPYKEDLSINKQSTILTILKNFLPGFTQLTITKPILKNFNFFTIPYQTHRRIRANITANLSTLMPNLGKLDLNAYSLLIGNTVGNGFKFFAKPVTGDNFKYFGGSISAHASYIHDKLEFGPQLDIFKWSGQRQSIEAFGYLNIEETLPDISFITTQNDLDFVQAILSKTTTHHPTKPGSLFDGFYLINQNGQNTYQITGFTYNGTQIIWS